MRGKSGETLVQQQIEEALAKAAKRGLVKKLLSDIADSVLKIWDFFFTLFPALAMLVLGGVVIYKGLEIGSGLLIVVGIVFWGWGLYKLIRQAYNFE